MVGALFLGSVAVVPSLLMALWHLNRFPFYGTTLLISVGVALETMRQIDSVAKKATAIGGASSGALWGDASNDVFINNGANVQQYTGSPTWANLSTGLNGVVNALSIDVEDYFQVSAFAPHIPRASWDAIPCRV